MSDNKNPQHQHDLTISKREGFLVASGDLRLSANQECWSAQEEMEAKLADAFSKFDFNLIRAHPYDPNLKHGFIWNQRMGMDVFRSIPKEAPVIIAIAVWQYSYHLLAGLRDRSGPILTVANWSGKRPGLVGLLNLNGCLTKLGIPYSTIWSEDFTDRFLLNGIEEWLHTGNIVHDLSHVRDLDMTRLPKEEYELGKLLGKQLKEKKAILGIFDEGCMGMYNAIIEDELLNECGIYKERLSQSALLAEMRSVKDCEVNAAKTWLDKRGMTFNFGSDKATQLTEYQVNEQLKMYIAAVRIAHLFGCDAIGIQYQQGLKDMTPASDLAEGLLNNVERPPVYHQQTGEEIFPNQALPHFNEVDEGAAIDCLITNRIWTALGFDPANTLHDIRWGKDYPGLFDDAFIWVFEISGAVPPSHLRGGYTGAVSERQVPMYFPLGGGTIKGVSKPGEIVWSRVYIEGGKLHADVGRGTVVELPHDEETFLSESTDPQWPMMPARLHGISRNQLMARHKANHIHVVYAPSPLLADKALAVKISMLVEIGIEVHICGDVKVG
ncbi:MAG: hypothetical protein JW908_01920 [Anaerolineales bacterium]|nr:hypothetical protein [Anaerolineales bacterium]